MSDKSSDCDDQNGVHSFVQKRAEINAITSAFRDYEYQTQDDWAITPQDKQPILFSGRHIPGICVRSSSPIKLNTEPLLEGCEKNVKKFEEALKTGNLKELKRLSWNGIPARLRGVCWRILLGYTVAVDGGEMLETKRLRHPASGYVQGMNDLVTPFLVVFLAEHLDIEEVLTLANQCEDRKSQLISKIDGIDEKLFRAIEADTFWCTWQMLDSLQDYYTFAQPAIQQSVRSLELLIKRVDDELYNHLKSNGIQFLQFTFRWMNNLLMREMPLRCIIRLFDAYHAEGKSNYTRLHLYVCAAFLQTFGDYVKQQTDFQGIMICLQNLPTTKWTVSDMNVLLARAYRLQCLFADCPKHLNINHSHPRTRTSN